MINPEILLLRMEIAKLRGLLGETVEVLERIKKRGDWLKRDCTESDKVMSYAIDINVIGNGVLAKAKEAVCNDPKQGD